MAKAIERSRNDTLPPGAWLELDIHFHRAGGPGAAEQAVARHVEDLERLYRRAGLLGPSPAPMTQPQASKTS
jgi:hypothetical protein